MTPADDLLSCAGLSERERRVVELRIRDGLRTNIVAKRLGISINRVYWHMQMAKRRASGKIPPVRSLHGPNNIRPLTMDAGWLDRNVALYRRSPHPQNYLNGVAIVWGQEWADRVEWEAGDVR